MKNNKSHQNVQKQAKSEEFRNTATDNMPITIDMGVNPKTKVVYGQHGAPRIQTKVLGP